MAIVFPTSLDALTNPSAGQIVASALIGDLADAVEALEAKVGVNSSAVTTSLDYRVSNTLQRGEVQAFYGQAPASTTTAQAFKGCLFTPTAATSIKSMTMHLSGTTNAATYQGKVYTLDSNAVGARTVATVVGATDVVTSSQTIGNGNNVLMQAHCSTPIALSAGVTYAIMFGCTSGGGSFALPVNYSWDCATSANNDSVPGSFGTALELLSAVAPPVVSSAVTVQAVASVGKRLIVGFVGTF